MHNLQKLPLELLNDAVFLSGDYCWPPVPVKLVIDWFSREGQAVVGVEWWRNAHGQAWWQATSHYDCSEVQTGPEYIECCRQAAHAFVDRFSDDPDALFNLTLDAHNGRYREVQND